MKSLTFALLLSGCTAWRNLVRKKAGGGSFVDEHAEGYALGTAQSNAGQRRRRRRRNNDYDYDYDYDYSGSPRPTPAPTGERRRRRYDGGGPRPTPTPAPTNERRRRRYDGGGGPRPTPAPIPNPKGLRAELKKSGSCQHIFHKEDCLTAAKLVGAKLSKTKLDGGSDWKCGGGTPCGCTLHSWGGVEWWGGHVIGNHACGDKARYGEYYCVCSLDAPPPTPAPQQALPNCGDIKPTHYYPLPSKTYTGGLPSPLLAHPPFMSMCDVNRLQDICVEQINKYRAGGVPFSDGRIRNHGQRRPLVRSSKVDKCLNEKAASDLMYSVHNGKGCGHHSASLNCDIDGLSIGVENSCCPRRCNSFESCKSTLLGCLRQMWDEGEIVLDTGSEEWSMKTGHYFNMLNEGAAYATCGFGFDNKGGFMATQQFY